MILKKQIHINKVPGEWSQGNIWNFKSHKNYTREELKKRNQKNKENGERVCLNLPLTNNKRFSETLGLLWFV